MPTGNFHQLWDATESLQHDADLLLRGIFPSGSYPNLLYEAPSGLGPGLSSISFIFVVFLGHNSLLSA